MTFAAMSDVRGVGSTTNEKVNTQGTWLILAADRTFAESHTVKVSPISCWKCQVEEKGVEHLGWKETMALSQAVAEAEWLHVMVRDMTDGDQARLVLVVGAVRRAGRASPCMTC